MLTRNVSGRCVGDAAVMQTTYSSQAGVDPEKIDRRIADIYRDVANELAENLHLPTGRPLAEAIRYPADLLALLPADAVNSFAGR